MWNPTSTLPKRIWVKPWTRFKEPQSLKTDCGSVTPKTESQSKCLEEPNFITFNKEIKDMVLDSSVRTWDKFLEVKLPMDLERKWLHKPDLANDLVPRQPLIIERPDFLQNYCIPKVLLLCYFLFDESCTKFKLKTDFNYLPHLTDFHIFETEVGEKLWLRKLYYQRSWKRKQDRIKRASGRWDKAFRCSSSSALSYTQIYAFISIQCWSAHQQPAN